MQKKALALLVVLSGNAYAANVELGFENERYTDKYKTSDVFMPYVATSFDPIDGSSLNISMKYMYQDQYGKKDATTEKDKFKTDRDRFEFFVKGYTWKNGGYNFAPQAGFRYEAWDVNYDSNTGRQDKRRLELRLYPNMTYQINKQTSLYLNGFVGPVFMETKQESRKDDGYVKGQLGTNKYYGDYYQELQLIGIKHKINDSNTVWSSIYNEFKYSEHASRYDRWQLRVGYEFKATNDLNINPFVRYDMHYREKNIESAQFSKDSGKSRSKDELRIGSTFNYKIVPSVMVLGEVYWQTAKMESYSGVTSDDKNRMFYKLGVRKTF